MAFNISFSHPGGLFPSKVNLFKPYQVGRPESFRCTAIKISYIGVLRGYAMKRLLFASFAVLAMFPINALAIEPIPVPEPASLVLIISGLAGVLGLRRIFKR